MKKVPPNRVRSHADFDLTPLGMWADRGDAALMPGARHFQYPASQTLFASDGLGEVLIRNQNFKAPKSSSDIDSLVWPFGAIEGGDCFGASLNAQHVLRRLRLLAMAASFMRRSRESLLLYPKFIRTTIKAGIGPKSVTCDGGACVAVSASRLRQRRRSSRGPGDRRLR
jgi:hypothetical protein